MTEQDQGVIEKLRKGHPLPEVVSLGRSLFDPIWREQEHAGRHSEVVHVLRGRVDQVRQDGSVHGEVGDTLYTPRGAPHRDVFDPDMPFEVYIVHFHWEGEAELLEVCPPVRLAAVGAGVKTRVGAEFVQLYRDFRQQGPMARELTGARLLQVLLMLTKAALGGGDEEGAVDEATSTRRRQIMNQARRLIQQDYRQALTLETIAEVLRISPYHLSHVFSAESGFTLSSYLTTVRMEQAAEQLQRGRHGVAEVAQRVGFRDPQYFSRVFKSHYGVSPSVFRAGGRQIVGKKHSKGPGD